MQPTPKPQTLDDADLEVLASEVRSVSRHEGGRLTTLALWHRESAFWREIYTRSMGGLGAALGLAIVALIVFSAEREGVGIVLIACLALLFATAISAAGFVVSNLRRRRHKEPPAQLTPFVVCGVVAFIVLLIVAGLADKALLARAEDQRLEHRAACLGRADNGAKRAACLREWGD